MLETVRTVVALCPPAVEDRKVQGPVEYGLLAAGSRGLKGGGGGC